MKENRFTERAKKVLFMAREEARRLQHDYVGTEHILLAMIREGQGVAATVLINLGLNLIDTARAYGEGHGERLVGRVVRERSERVFVATKVPPKNLIWPAPDGIDVAEVYPGDHVRRSAAQHLDTQCSVMVA